MSFFNKSRDQPSRNSSALNAHISTWSFKKLYDTLNTSNDVAVLEACHNEYLRRGHAYYVWKQTSQGTIDRTTMENSAVPSNSGRNIESKQNTSDLTKWSSQQLKESIETSDNTELLRACRIECNRRITEYERSLGRLELRAMEEIQKLFLKQNHQNEEKMLGIPRGSGVFEVGEVSNPFPERESNYRPERESNYHPPEKPVLEPRCFKVSAVGLTEGVYGWWYGHFQGQHICREMEIIGHQPPLLLTQGKDDALMCKLNLEETGLESKIGAKIPLEEFEREWRKHRAAIQSSKPL